jgi:4-alpha-glucanotransferase
MTRRGLRHAAALRMDHVMQLSRLFCVPGGAHAGDGAYVTYPVDQLLAILRIEAARAGAWIVREDMGTVEDGVRETMPAIGMLGYRVAARTDPNGNPECSLAACATHDQPTIAGALTGSDEADMLRIGKAFGPAGLAATRRELARRSGLDPDQASYGPREVARALVAEHARIASSPSLIALASLDDLEGVAERPNMPGTVDQYPNWRVALPCPVGGVLAAPLARSINAALSGHGRSAARRAA